MSTQPVIHYSDFDSHEMVRILCTQSENRNNIHTETGHRYIGVRNDGRFFTARREYVNCADCLAYLDAFPEAERIR